MSTGINQHSNVPLQEGRNVVLSVMCPLIQVRDKVPPDNTRAERKFTGAFSTKYFPRFWRIKEISDNGLFCVAQFLVFTGLEVSEVSKLRHTASRNHQPLRHRTHSDLTSKNNLAAICNESWFN